MFIEIGEITITLIFTIMLTDLLIYMNITEPKQRLRRVITRVLTEDKEKKKTAQDLLARLKEAEAELPPLEDAVLQAQNKLGYWGLVFGKLPAVKEKKKELEESLQALEEKKKEIEAKKHTIAQDFDYICSRKPVENILGTFSKKTHRRLQQEPDNLNARLRPIFEEALQETFDNRTREKISQLLRRLQVEADPEAAASILKDFPAELQNFNEIYPTKLVDLRKKYCSTTPPAGLDNDLDLDLDNLIPYFFGLGLFFVVISGIVLGIKTYKKHPR